MIKLLKCHTSPYLPFPSPLLSYPVPRERLPSPYFPLPPLPPSSLSISQTSSTCCHSSQVIFVTWLNKPIAFLYSVKIKMKKKKVKEISFQYRFSSVYLKGVKNEYSFLAHIQSINQYIFLFLPYMVKPLHLFSVITTQWVTFNDKSIHSRCDIDI